MEIVFPVLCAQSGLRQQGASGRIPGLPAGCRENRFGHHVPRASEAQEPKPAEKPLAFEGGVQAPEGAPLGLAPGPREGPPIMPGPWEPHEAS